MNERLTRISEDMVRRKVSIVLTQLISLSFLRRLWASEIRTAIIFQNEEPTWSYSPSELCSSKVPFLLTTCRTLSGHLHARQPDIPVRIIRPLPELPVGFQSRDTLRRSWGIPSDALIIGMIGTFKLHKRYTQAVRILHCINQKRVNAHLVIAGGHSELYGGGAQAYSAVMRLADELGVGSRVHCPGELDCPGDLHDAFDVFLNTSLYEGVSRATISAVAQGCPVVTTDVGGQAEVLSPRDCAVPASATPIEIANAIMNRLRDGTEYPEPAEIAAQLAAARQRWQIVWRTLHSLAAQRGEPEYSSLEDFK